MQPSLCKCGHESRSHVLSGGPCLFKAESGSACLCDGFRAVLVGPEIPTPFAPDPAPPAQPSPYPDAAERRLHTVAMMAATIYGAGAIATAFAGEVVNDPGLRICSVDDAEALFAEAERRGK